MSVSKIYHGGGPGRGRSYSGSGGLSAHDLAGAFHNADTITNLNTKLSDGSLITSKAGEINAFTSKATPVNADILLIEDSAAAWAKKKITLSSLPYPSIFGFYDDAGSDGQSTTTSTSYVDKLNWTTPVLPVGMYLLMYCWEARNDTLYYTTGVQVLRDTVQIAEVAYQTNDNTAWDSCGSGMNEFTVGSPATVLLQIQYKRWTANGTARIRRARFKLLQVA